MAMHTNSNRIIKIVLIALAELENNHCTSCDSNKKRYYSSWTKGLCSR